MDPSPRLPDVSETSLKSRLALEEEEYQDGEPRTLSDAHWSVQPRWVKTASVIIGLPSFLYLGLRGGHDPLETTLGTISLIGFASVALLQLIFVFRGYWRMDI
jgi:hypothetical protein